MFRTTLLWKRTEKRSPGLTLCVGSDHKIHYVTRTYGRKVSLVLLPWLQKLKDICKGWGGRLVVLSDESFVEMFDMFTDDHCPELSEAPFAGMVLALTTMPRLFSSTKVISISL